MIISCKNVHASYGQSEILFGVDLNIEAGELVALLGVNGAGKSTLLKVICGLLKPTRGTIDFEGTSIIGLNPETIASKAISLVPGGQGVFPTLSVEDNLKIAQWQIRKNDREKRSRLDYALSLFPALSNRYSQLAGNLSGGEQQMLALSQSLITAPKVLLIDELSLGLAPIVVGSLVEVVKGVNQYGTTVVLVEQSLNLALQMCNRAIFMEKGTVRFDGASAQLRQRPDLLRSVFLEGASKGELSGKVSQGNRPDQPSKPLDHWGPSASLDADRASTNESEQSGQPEITWQPGDLVKTRSLVLEVRNISVRFGSILALQDVSLILHEGEIMSIIGANGAGKTTLFDVISGFLRPDSGRVIFNGKNVTRNSPARRSRLGLGRSFQDALLFSSLTVHETIMTALDRHQQSKDPISLALGFPLASKAEADSRGRTEQLIELTGLGDYKDSFLSELSTGTRRMVDLACSLAHDPSALLLDEPAAGIAQKETEALGPLIERIRDEVGTSILIIEHDMPLISKISDRVLVLELGQVLTCGEPDDVLSDPRVIESYLGSELTAINRSGED